MTRRHIVHICPEHSAVCTELGALKELGAKFVSYKWLVTTVLASIGTIIGIAFTLHAVWTSTLKESEEGLVARINGKAESYKLEWALSDLAELKKSIGILEKNQIKFMIHQGIKPVKESEEK